MQILAALLALSLGALSFGAAANELEKSGRKAESEVKKGLKQVGEATQKVGKKFDKGVHDAVKSLKKSLNEK